MIKLLPCPFCGKTPIEFATLPDTGGKWGAVLCCIYGPDVRTYYEKTGWEEAAAVAWNTRSVPEGNPLETS